MHHYYIYDANDGNNDSNDTIEFQSTFDIVVHKTTQLSVYLGKGMRPYLLID
jgi:hypothetical protein